MLETQVLGWEGPASVGLDGPARVLTGNCGFTEGPVWRPSHDDWVFSDIPRSTMWRWSPTDGLSVFRSPSHKANGNALDLQGAVVTCEHATSRVVRESADGLDVVAQTFEGKRLNSPNDVVVASDGSMLFTDPRYGLTVDFGEERDQELGFQGVYLVEDGVIRLLDDRYEEPNGLCLSPDESVLYVNDTVRGSITRYAVGPGWDLGPRENFAAPESGPDGVPDGMKCDRHGNVWCTGAGGLWVFDPDGRTIGRLRLPHLAANFAFGAPDGDEMLITAGATVYLQRLTAPLARPSRKGLSRK